MRAPEKPYLELEYTSGYYHELGPAHLAFCALVAGVDRPMVPRPAYLELGMGQGVSLVAHAAANDGQFWGVDLNPAHLANARALAEAASTPVTMIEASFTDFAARADLPLFDVITLHGVWSWVSDDSRRSIVRILRDQLAPGGVVYLSYNCMPGWASRGPVRHLMKLGHEASERGAPEDRVASALAFAEEIAAADGRFFAENRPAASHLASMRKSTRQYLGHEYLNADWHIPYFSDVAEMLAEADLTFVGSARLLDRVNAIHLKPAGVALMDREKDPIRRESIRDFLVNQQFRTDVFFRPARRLSEAERVARLEDQAFVLICGLDEIDFRLTGAQGEMALPEATYRPIALALAADSFAVKSGAEVMAAPGVSSVRRGDVIEALMTLVGMGVVRPAKAISSEARQRCDAYNRLVFDRALTGSRLMHLASPVTGGGVLTPRSAQLFLRAWTGGDRSTPALARSVQDVFRVTGERVVMTGEPLTSDEDTLRALVQMAERFVDQTVPLYRALAII